MLLRRRRRRRMILRIPCWKHCLSRKKKSGPQEHKQNKEEDLQPCYLILVYRQQLSSASQYQPQLSRRSFHTNLQQKMRGLLTTQSQNCYKEQIQKEMLTRLTWKSRYAKLYPSTLSLQNSTESMQLPPGTRTPEKQKPPPHPPSLTPTMEKEQRQPAPPLMKPASPQTRKVWLQDSSHPQGTGRSLYMQRRSHVGPEEKFDFPLLSSWEYGWRLGDYTLDYRTPSHARSAVVEKTFYSKNGVFRNPSATDSMG